MKANKPALFKKAFSKGVGGGVMGSVSVGFNVTSLMWLRTVSAYQHFNGSGTLQAIQHLNNNGGVRRFYRGFVPSLVIASLIRFGDVFANTGVNELFDGKNVPILAKTFVSTSVATIWRVFLMPLDTQKTIYQVFGDQGSGVLLKKLRRMGFRGLYGGSLMQTSGAFLTHYPWFCTYNFLYKYFPDLKSKVLRNGMIGFLSSSVAVCANNFTKVMKLHKQSSFEKMSYKESLVEIKKAGVRPCSTYQVFMRGLGTRIMLCGLQGFLFTITWKYLEEKFRGSTPKY